MKSITGALVALLLVGLLAPGAVALEIVSTMPNVHDVTTEIGGDRVSVISIAQPTAIHISSETIDASLQQHSEFIQNADLFVGQGAGMDATVIGRITEFRRTNFGVDTPWRLINETPASAVPNATPVYDNPGSLKGYSAAVAWILSQADPANATVYAENLRAYHARIDEATVLNQTERAILSTTPIISHFRINNQAVTWLGMDAVASYPTPTAVVDIVGDIINNTEKYRAIAKNSSSGKIVVVENIVAGQDLGIPIHEALVVRGIPAERAVFLNLPRSAPGVDTILDYYAYNRDLILGLVAQAPVSNTTGTLPATTPAPTAAPLGFVPVLGALACAAVLLRRP